MPNFAFTLMHEIGHIAIHLYKNRNAEFIDIYRNKHKNIAEMEADSFAQMKLISENIWNEVIKNHIPLDDSKIIDLGTRFRINPAILLRKYVMK